MKDAIRYIARYIGRKHLELLLFVILATLLYSLQVSLPVAFSVLTAVGLILGTYEWKPVRESPYFLVAMIKRFSLEIVLFVILGFLMMLWEAGLELSGIVLFVYFISIIGLNSRYVQWGIARGLGDMRRDALSFALLIIFLTLLIIWEFKTESIFFLITFSAFLLYGWDSRVVAGGALVSLASCPFLLIVGEDAFAEQMAVYAYYFLVMTVVLQIIEFKLHPELSTEEEKPVANRIIDL